MVMTGMRVQMGSQAIERAPSYVEVFGRTMQINLTRARWFDFPFTREEALQADKKLSIFSKIKIKTVKRKLYWSTYAIHLPQLKYMSWYNWLENFEF